MNEHFPQKINKDAYFPVFVSMMFCVLQVKAYPSVAAHMLHDLEGVTKTSSTEPTLILIDIAGYAVVFCCLHMASVIQPLGRTHP